MRADQYGIFGYTYNGVPSPQVFHHHPYPTRYHGFVRTMPEFGLPVQKASWMSAQRPNYGLGGVTPEDFWSAARLVSATACTYHGYRRNQSVGWALVWGLLGAAFPIITPTIAVAQGFGEKR